MCRSVAGRRRRGRVVGRLVGRCHAVSKVVLEDATASRKRV